MLLSSAVFAYGDSDGRNGNGKKVYFAGPMFNHADTVQCSGSNINPAGGDEYDDHHPAGLFLLRGVKKHRGLRFGS